MRYAKINYELRIKNYEFKLSINSFFLPQIHRFFVGVNCESGTGFFDSKNFSTQFLIAMLSHYY